MRQRLQSVAAFGARERHLQGPALPALAMGLQARPAQDLLDQVLEVQSGIGGDAGERRARGRAPVPRPRCARPRSGDRSPSTRPAPRPRRPGPRSSAGRCAAVIGSVRRRSGPSIVHCHHCLHRGHRRARLDRGSRRARAASRSAAPPAIRDPTLPAACRPAPPPRPPGHPPGARPGPRRHSETPRRPPLPVPARRWPATGPGRWRRRRRTPPPESRSCRGDPAPIARRPRPPG